MVVSQLADSISKSGSFGLAKSLAGELQRQTGHAGAVRGQRQRFPTCAAQDPTRAHRPGELRNRS